VEKTAIFAERRMSLSSAGFLSIKNNAAVPDLGWVGLVMESNIIFLSFDSLNESWAWNTRDLCRN
jgi:hypothetical protein